jgi:DNA-binding HxlR family transcriptional regulator
MSKSSTSPNVFSSQCPSRRVMAVLAEKWTLLIVTQLANGPCARGDSPRRGWRVREDADPDSAQARRLRLVSRKAYPEVPPRVEYKLTPLGRSLARLAGLFSRWVERNVSSLLKAEQDAA